MPLVLRALPGLVPPALGRFVVGLLVLSAPLRALPAPADAADTAPRLGPWHAWLDSPGGELPFGLELAREAPPADAGGGPEEGTEAGAAGTPSDAETGAVWRAWIRNGVERIPVPRVTLEGGELGLHLDHYDSRLTARVSEDGSRLDGTWEKRRGPQEWTRMAFHAVAGEHPRFPAAADPTLPGVTEEELLRIGARGTMRGEEEQRWRVRFSTREDPAVLILRREEGQPLMGTFLTTTGDYRYLSGRLGTDGLHLSAFDGAHAFLFRAEVEWPGMRGHFWSRDTWHETWTAEWDPYAGLPNAFDQTRWRADALLAELVFPDLEGNPRSLADPELAGRARILQVFGSWCPNCHDEAPFLVELHRRYERRGLTIVGLAFELTGDFERDAEQVRRYRARHGIEFPLLLAGTADKERATEALGLLDRVRSYPTTIFLHGDNTVDRVHTGFVGPGTGAPHQELRDEFTSIVERLLRERTPDDSNYWRWLDGRPWVLREAFGGTTLTFFQREGGRRFVRRERHDRGGPASSEELPMTLARGSVAFGDELWYVDRRAIVLADPFDFGRRLSPDPTTATPLLATLEIPNEEEALVEAVGHEDLSVRREAVRALALWRANHRERGLPEGLELLGEETETSLRVAAAWAVGRTFEVRAVDALFANLDHPFARLRRESARSLARLASLVPGLAERLEERPPDFDPLVREAVAAGIAAGK